MRTSGRKLGPTRAKVGGASHEDQDRDVQGRGHRGRRTAAVGPRSPAPPRRDPNLVVVVGSRAPAVGLVDNQEVPARANSRRGSSCSSSSAEASRSENIMILPLLLEVRVLDVRGGSMTVEAR